MTSCSIMLGLQYTLNPRHDSEEITSLQWHENRRKIDWQLRSTMHQLPGNQFINMFHWNNGSSIFSISVKYWYSNILNFCFYTYFIVDIFVQSQYDIAGGLWYYKMIFLCLDTKGIMKEPYEISWQQSVLVAVVPFIKVMMSDLRWYPNWLF